jgi:acyl-coenzyme A synthetase/AMP-(fatty) acid ligase
MQVLLSCLVGGGKIVAFTDWTIRHMCDAVRDYAVTHMSATPTFWRAFVIALDKVSSAFALKHITLGGEVADQAILSRLRELFPNAGITHIYASTEAGALFAVRDGRAGFPAEWLESGIGGVELRLRDGILEVRSPRAMRGYVNRDRDASVTEDGWLITNDLIDIREERALFRGRADAVINVGGAKVCPEEVEAALLEHPDVVDVVVYGAANPITGATVVADVRPAADADQAALRRTLVQHARQRLEPYKVPRVFRFAQDIDTTDAGKKGRRK